jgi:phosphoenolpyruvate-protein phosphotransferase
LRGRQARIAARREADAAASAQPAETRDGHRVQVAANIGSVEEAQQAAAAGADGVGLLRSEFLFLDRPQAPSEDEQYAIYRGAAEALGPKRPLIVRLLDVGGDKPLAYLPMPAEENPFLGIRGARLFLLRPELLRTQARAVLRAAQGFDVRVMVPMIATVADFRSTRAVFEEERQKLGLAPVPLGIMVEVPSAALLADVFAREADFFSIGTNDLTQYTLAMDRGHAQLAAQVDGLEPAILRLVAQTVKAADAHGRHVGVCGALGGDPVAVPVLVGLGVHELSVAVPALPAVKARVRELDFAACRVLAEKALLAESGAAVRALVAAEG